jgi:hypothetical protein
VLLNIIITVLGTSFILFVISTPFAIGHYGQDKLYVKVCQVIMILSFLAGVLTIATFLGFGLFSDKNYDQRIETGYVELVSQEEGENFVVYLVFEGQDKEHYLFATESGEEITIPYNEAVIVQNDTQGPSIEYYEVFASEFGRVQLRNRTERHIIYLPSDYEVILEKN